MKKYTIVILILFTSLLSAQVMQNEEPVDLPSNDSKFLSDQIIVQGLYIRTLGNFNKVWTSGSGGYVSYGMFFPDHNTLNFQIGYIDYKLQEGFDSQEELVRDASLYVIPLLIGGKYFFIDSWFMPYFSFMNGINIVNQTVSIEVEEDADGNENIHIDNTTGDETLVRYAWQVAFGIMISIVDGLNLDLAVKYNAHFYQHEAMNTGFEYGFGLVWSLNK